MSGALPTDDAGDPFPFPLSLLSWGGDGLTENEQLEHAIQGDGTPFSDGDYDVSSNYKSMTTYTEDGEATHWNMMQVQPEDANNSEVLCIPEGGDASDAVVMGYPQLYFGMGLDTWVARI